MGEWAHVNVAFAKVGLSDMYQRLAIQQDRQAHYALRVVPKPKVLVIRRTLRLIRMSHCRVSGGRDSWAP